MRVMTGVSHATTRQAVALAERMGDGKESEGLKSASCLLELTLTPTATKLILCVRRENYEVDPLPDAQPDGNGLAWPTSIACGTPNLSEIVTLST